MILEMDNKGACDLANNCSVGGRTRHIEARKFCIRDLKEEGILQIKWIPGGKNEADLLTNNLPRPDFKNHAETILAEY